MAKCNNFPNDEISSNFSLLEDLVDSAEMGITEMLKIKNKEQIFASENGYIIHITANIEYKDRDYRPSDILVYDILGRYVFGLSRSSETSEIMSFKFPKSIRDSRFYKLHHKPEYVKLENKISYRATVATPRETVPVPNHF